MPSGVFYFQIENITVCHRIKGPCDKIAGSNFGQPQAARRASAWMARITKLQGAILDSRRLPAGRVPGWHESLNCREQFWTAAGCPQGECLDGTSQSRSGSRLLPVRKQIAVLKANIRYIPVAHLRCKLMQALFKICSCTFVDI